MVETRVDQAAVSMPVSDAKLDKVYGAWGDAEDQTHEEDNDGGWLRMIKED